MLVQMTVETLAVTTDGGPCAVVLRGVRLPVILPIAVSPQQAAAIAAVNFTFPRPLTHDLFTVMLHELGGKIERAVIHDVQDSTFLARLEVSRAADPATTPDAPGPHQLDCRPSDAIALAVRLNLPLLVSSTVLSRAEGVRWGHAGSGEGQEGGGASQEPPVSDEQLAPFRSVVEKLNLEEL